VSEAVINALAPFGPWAILVAILLAGFWLVLKEILADSKDRAAQWSEVVRNNTAAMQKVADSTDFTCQKLSEHDEHAQTIGDDVKEIRSTVARTEARVNGLHDRLNMGQGQGQGTTAGKQ